MADHPFTPHADSIQTAWVLMCQQSRIATQPPVEELEAEFDRFIERVKRDALAAAEHRADEAEKVHRDLTSSLGFGDGITEPMADNKTIIQYVGEAVTDAQELWELTQAACVEAECDPEEDCDTHHPVHRAERAEHRATRAEAQSAIRGRAVVMYRERVREAEAERDEWRQTALDERAAALDALEQIKAREARIKAVERLALAADDGTEYEHNGHDPAEGEAECPGCWALGIRRALDGDA